VGGDAEERERKGSLMPERDVSLKGGGSCPSYRAENVGQKKKNERVDLGKTVGVVEGRKSNKGRGKATKGRRNEEEKRKGPGESLFFHRKGRRKKVPVD